MRLLSVVGQRVDGRAAYLTIAKNLSVEWRVTDLLLWQPVNQDIGLSTHEPALITYMVAYLDVVAANRAISTKSSIRECTLIPGVFEWPQGGGQQYFGVEATLTIQEVI